MTQGERTKVRTERDEPTTLLSQTEIFRGVRRVVQRDAPARDGLPAVLRRDENAQGRIAGSIYGRLRDGTYRFEAGAEGRVVREGRPDRLHCVSTLHDGALLGAVAEVVADAWSRIHLTLQGGRKEVSCHDVLRAVQARLAQVPHGTSVDLGRMDIQGAFAGAPFERALDALSRRTARPEVLTLVAAFAEAQKGRFPGLIEGSPVAPLMLAALLDDILVPALGHYADDTVIWFDDGLVIAPAGEGAMVLKIIEAALDTSAGMKLHPDKSFVVVLGPDGNAALDFLGFDLIGRKPAPSPASCAALLTALEECVSAKDYRGFAANVVGWTDYFSIEPDWHGLAVLDEQIHDLYRGKVPLLPSLRVLAARSTESRGAHDLRTHRGTRTTVRTKSTRWETFTSSSYLPSEGASFGEGEVFGTKGHDSVGGEAAPGARSSSRAAGALRARGQKGGRRRRRDRLRGRLRNVARELQAILREFPEMGRVEYADTLNELFRALDAVIDAASPALNNRGEPKLAALTFMMAPDQKVEVELALARAAELATKRSRSGYLSLICTDFVATNDVMASDTDKRLRYVAQLERHLGIKLVAVDSTTGAVLYGIGALRTAAGA